MKRYITLVLSLIYIVIVTIYNNAPTIDNRKPPGQVTAKDTLKDNTDITKNLSTENSPIELDLICEGYRAIWKESYHYDVPILIDNLTALTDFLKKHPAQSATGDTLQQNYNEEFFKHSIMYAYVKSEGSGSINLIAKNAELNGDQLNLYMERTSQSEGTDDMAALVCLFGIIKDDNKNVKSAVTIISDRDY